MINIDFKFRAVGQGAFYTGIFRHENGKQFTFVYDCGSHSSRQYINQEISNFVTETKKQKIDILFISHFHSDHTNKITELLNQTNGAKMAILPYLTPEELVLAYIDVSVSGGDPETLAFIQNPASFLLERKVEQIIYIHPSDENNSNTNDEPNLKEPDLERILSPDFEFQISNRLVPNENIKEQNPNVLHCYDLGWFSIVGFWEFKFFNKQRNIITFNNFISDIKLLLGLSNFSFSDIANYINSNPTTFESNLNAIYSRNFGYGQLINDTSLIIFHAPLINIDREHLMYLRCFPFWRGRNTGTLLTGDIKFNQDCLNQITAKWINRKYFDNVGLFQIPHHGANNYLDPVIFTSYPNVYFWVINFGLGNTHKHPRQEIVNMIENNKRNGKIFANTQVNAFNYGCRFI